MKIAEELIGQIEKKVEQLVNNLEGLRSENELLNKQINELELTIDNKNKELEILTKKIETIRISKAIGDKEERAEARNKINEILREIDRCVGLLNR